MYIRRIENSDIPALSILHRGSFDKKHFTASFPLYLLNEYLRVMISYNNYSFLAEDSGKILGYLVGGNQVSAGLNLFLKQNFFGIFLHLLFHPQFIMEKIKSAYIKFKGIKLTEAEYKVYIIAVTPEAKGQGIGKQLMQQFEAALKKDSIIFYGLSVRKENISAAHFYENNNFIKENEIFNSVYYIKYL